MSISVYSDLCLFIPNFVLFLITFLKRRILSFFKCSYCSICGGGLEGTIGSRKNTKQKDERNDNLTEGRTKIPPLHFWHSCDLNACGTGYVYRQKRLCCSMETNAVLRASIINTCFSDLPFTSFTYSQLHGLFPVKMLLERTTVR